LLREVIAFANAQGGNVIVGMDETRDDPPRAAAICPLPRIHVGGVAGKGALLPLQGIPVSIKDLEGQKQPDLLALRRSQRSEPQDLPVLHGRLPCRGHRVRAKHASILGDDSLKDFLTTINGRRAGR
jgi:hypothetical protein